jgi:hypothetical protein
MAAERACLLVQFCGRAMQLSNFVISTFHSFPATQSRTALAAHSSVITLGRLEAQFAYSHL